MVNLTTVLGTLFVIIELCYLVISFINVLVRKCSFLLKYFNCRDIYIYFFVVCRAK